MCSGRLRILVAKRPRRIGPWRPTARSSDCPPQAVGVRACHACSAALRATTVEVSRQFTVGSSHRSFEPSSSRASRIPAPARNGWPNTCSGLSTLGRDKTPARSSRAMLAPSSTSFASSTCPGPRPNGTIRATGPLWSRTSTDSPDWTRRRDALRSFWTSRIVARIMPTIPFSRVSQVCQVQQACCQESGRSTRRSSRIVTDASPTHRRHLQRAAVPGQPVRRLTLEPHGVAASPAMPEKSRPLCAPRRHQGQAQLTRAGNRPWLARLLVPSALAPPRKRAGHPYQ